MLSILRKAGASCLFLFILIATAAADLPSRALSDAEWRDDLQQLADAIRDQHFKPFHVLSAAEFDADLQALHDAIPTLSDKAIVIAMAQLVARLRDGHTRLHLPRLYPELALRAELGHSGTDGPRSEALRFHQLPVKLELFEDGLFVIATSTAHRALLGHRVLAFDDTSTEQAIDRVQSVSFFENTSRARLMAPDRLALPEVLAALEITRAGDELTLHTVDANGNELRTRLRGLDRPGTGLIHGLPANLPHWLARPKEYQWYEVLQANDAIYVQVNEFEEMPDPPYATFVAETLAAARKAGVSRYVLDLRHNFGGIGAWVTPFVNGLGTSEFNRYGQLYVLTGRTTFSAAQLLLHRFEELTYAMFVGEPSGAKPSHFGDARRIVLEHSGLTLRVSTIYWHSWLANDFRDAIAPHIDAPLRASDWFSGHDPALAAALAYVPPPDLATQMEEQFRQEKNQNALLLFQRYITDGRIASMRDAVAGLHAMADRLAEDGLHRPAYFVYLLTDRSFPGNPQTEAGLERTGKLVD